MYCKKCRRDISDATWHFHIQRCGVEPEKYCENASVPETKADELKTEAENTTKEPEVKLVDLKYDELKTEAEKLGIEYQHNIKKADLIELIENKIKEVK